MSDEKQERSSRIGRVEWMDLTIDDAEGVREFYEEVVGWDATPVPQKDYNDYCMGKDGGTIGGVCHRRGPNSDMPASWIIYINVDNLEQSMAKVKAKGGQVLGEPRGADGHGKYCLIQDPGGAVCALFEPE